MPDKCGGLDEWERRTLLKTMGPAGLGLIAGCLGDDGDGTDGDSGPDADVPGVGDDGDSDMDGDTDGDSDDGDDTTPVEDLVDPRDYVIEGQTLRLPLDVADPSTAFFIQRQAGRGVYDVPGVGADVAMDVANGQLANGPGFHSAFNMEWQDFFSHFYEGDADSVWGEEILQVEINEDATWSDGQPVRAFDTVLCNPGAACLGPNLPGEGHDGRYFLDLPDGRDGKVMEAHVLPSWLGDGPKGMEPPGPKDEFQGWRETPPSIYQPQTLGNQPKRGGVTVHYPSHIDPFDRQAELWWEVIQFRDKLIEENPQVWNDAESFRNFREEDPDGRRPFFRLWQDEAPGEWIEPWGGQLCWWQNARVTVGEGDEPAVQELYEKSRDPDWMTSLGLYEIDEIVGAEGYRLVPNENHMFYDEHTFDEVFVEWVPEDHREKAGIMANRYDWSGASLAPEEQAVVPSEYELKTYPANSGFSLSLNHGYWPGYSVRVRQGLKFATDETAIATNVNPDTNVPIHTPGLNNWGATEFLDEGWAEQHLTRYETDRDRAESLFEQAGFERGPDGNWRDPTGKPIEEVIATTDDAPVAEETVVSQWREFGIQIETLVQDESTFQDRWEGPSDPLSEGVGGYAIAVNVWPSQTFSGFFSTAMSNVGTANTFTFRRRARNWYDEQGGHGTPQDKRDFTEQVIRQGYAPINYASPGSFTSPWRIPPVGEFDAPQSDWVPFDHAWIYDRIARGPFDFEGQAMPTNEALAEAGAESPKAFDPDALGVENTWEAFAWSFNWFLPDLPLVRQTNESYLNTSNFHWGGQVPDVDGLATPLDVVDQNWDFWGLGTPAYSYPGNNMVWGDPANPKLNAEVRRTD